MNWKYDRLFMALLMLILVLLQLNACTGPVNELGKSDTPEWAVAEGSTYYVERVFDEDGQVWCYVLILKTNGNAIQDEPVGLSCMPRDFVWR